MTDPQSGQGNRYTWFVGVVALAIVIYITVNTIVTGGKGSRGLQAGDSLPSFAAPLWNSHFPNGADADTGGSKVPPCKFNAPGVMNVCQLKRRHLVLAFMVIGNGTCERQLDTMQKVMPQFPQVNFAAVAIKASRTDLAREVRKHGWTFPVAYDNDGAVSTNLYDIVVCPAVTFAYPGGRVLKTSLGAATTHPAVLATEIRTLLRTPPPPPRTVTG
jgi:hypothetical protein